MKKDMRYTAISRTTKKEYINVIDDHIKHKATKETDFDRMKQRKKRERDLNVHFRGASVVTTVLWRQRPLTRLANLEAEPFKLYRH